MKKPAERREPPPSRLREHRVRRGLTQAVLGKMAGLHANSIKNLENGVTREVSAENAAALAKALGLPVEELGLRVKSSGPAPSVRMRQLTPDQRAVVEEILALPPEAFEFMREAIRKLREDTVSAPSRKKGRRR